MLFAGWLLAVVSVLLCVLYFLNMPFYSGSTLTTWCAWRMEHGRMKVEVRASGVANENFYIAINSEGLRFKPELRVSRWDDWMVNVPLWMPVLASTGGSAWLFRASRRERTGCRKCGYDLKGLPEGAKCPECGEGERNRKLANGQMANEEQRTE